MSAPLSDETPRHCLIGFWPDYEMLFFRQAQQQGYPLEVLNLSPPGKRPGRFLKKWHKFSRDYRCRQAIRQCSQNPETVLIVQDNIFCLNALQAVQPDNACAVLCRNPVAQNPAMQAAIVRLQQRGTVIWSFDPDECAGLGYRRYRQIIEPLMEAATPEIDLAFIGQDKGRRELITQLQQGLAAFGRTVQVEIRSNNKKQASQPLRGYPDYLAQVLKARCLLDIVQPHQTGITLRPLEAMMYQRKVISNNPKLCDEPCYDPANVYLLDNHIDTGTVAAIEAFLQIPLRRVPDEIRQLYRCGAVLSDVAEKTRALALSQNRLSQQPHDDGFPG